MSLFNSGLGQILAENMVELKKYINT